MKKGKMMWGILAAVATVIVNCGAVLAVDGNPPVTVPEPNTILLVLSGITGAGGFALLLRKKK